MHETKDVAKGSFHFDRTKLIEIRLEYGGILEDSRSQVTLGLASLTNLVQGSGLRWKTALKNLDVRKQEGGEEKIVYLIPPRAPLAFTHPNSLALIHHLPLFLKSDTRAKGEAKKRTLPSWTANHNPRSLLSAHNHTIEFNKQNRKLNS